MIKIPESRTEHDKKMDKTAVRIGNMLHGHNHFDVVFICCSVIAFAMLNMRPEMRKEVRDKAVKFMDDMVAKGM
jgi:cytochrome c556